VNINFGDQGGNLFGTPDCVKDVNLVVIFNLFSGDYEKIFFSFNKITSLAILGTSESILAASKIDGTIDIFNLRKTGQERYYMNFETKVNPMLENHTRDNTPNKFKLILPIHTLQSESTSKIVKLRKRVIEGINSRVIKLYSLSLDGKIEIYEMNDSTLDELKEVSKNTIKKINTLDISTHFNNFSDLGKLKCLDINFSRKAGNYSDIIYILTNFGLIKLSLAGRNDFIVNSIFDIGVTAFDVSDNGYVLAAFNDLMVRLYDETSLNMVFQMYAEELSCDTIIDKIYFSDIVCKDENNKLLRRTLLANMFAFTTKNEFIIFDLNQKVGSKVRKYC
jgi:WD40 repeat protein